MNLGRKSRSYQRFVGQKRKNRFYSRSDREMLEGFTERIPHVNTSVQKYSSRLLWSHSRFTVFRILLS